MGKHTKFDNSDEEPLEDGKKTQREDKRKKEMRDRSRSPHKERNRSPKREHHAEKGEARRRDDKDHGRRREHERDFRRDDRRNDRSSWKRERNDRSDHGHDIPKREEKKRLSAEEIAAQRKALWGNKKAQAPFSTASEPITTSPEIPGKNEKLWSSAIAATGVDSSQANKFMRLMGVKNAPKPTEDSSKLSAEKSRQNQMLNDLEKQYAIARETTHMGRGTGFGFGH